MAPSIDSATVWGVPARSPRAGARLGKFQAVQAGGPSFHHETVPGMVNAVAVEALSAMICAAQSTAVCPRQKVSGWSW